MNDHVLWTGAMVHISVLVNDIGPRPAGSEAEKMALSYVENQLKKFGYRTERMPVTFAPHPGFFILYIIGALILLLGSWSIYNFPIGAVLLPLLIIALPQLSNWQFRLRPETEKDENVVAYSEDQSDKPTLILCAHVDSAPTSAFTSKTLLWLHGQSLFLAQRVSIAISALALLNIFGFNLPDWLILVVNLSGSLVAIGWILLEVFSQLKNPPVYSKGALDNASGVGISLSVAEHFANKPFRYIRLGFLFTTAEETGLHGSSSFVRQLTEPDQHFILNLDMLAAGDILYYITGDGTIWRRDTNQEMNSILKDVHPTIKPLWHTRRSGDYLPFLEKRIPAASLESGGSREVEICYHSIYDTIDQIQQTRLQDTIQTVIDFINRFQYQEPVETNKGF